MTARQGRVLVFIHIPKTAGTTLMRRILNLNESGHRNNAIGNVFKGGGGTSKVLLEQLRDGKGPNLGGVRIVTGHLPLGIREYLPQCFPKDRNFHYFTFLREPIDRTLSHYFQICEVPEGAYQLPTLSPEATLDDALEGGYLHDNLQTRMLSGLAEPFGEVTEAMLEQAKHNLREELAFFGLTERFDESLVLAKQRLGLRSILYEASGRVNTTRPRGKEVPAELVEAAERCNRYDIELYRYAQELFDSAPERAELDFQVELAAFHAAKVDGEIKLEARPPAGFGGDEEAWRMLLYARAALLREERECALFRLRRLTPGSAAQDGTKNELEAARARGKELEKEVRRLEADLARGKELKQSLDAARARGKALKLELKRLEVARSRPQRAAKRPSSKSTRSTRSNPQRAAKRAGPKQGRAARTNAPAGGAQAKKRRPPPADTGAVRRAKAIRRRRDGNPDEGTGGDGG